MKRIRVNIIITYNCRCGHLQEVNILVNFKYFNILNKSWYYKIILFISFMTYYRIMFTYLNCKYGSLINIVKYNK